ncbi:hypothetical protein PPL_11098 [Heterostelium album PN500]|uniref:RNB domain-containing protein n=1 Tax=Heterostelium pallidum (strain ATCC 26659 / Pp 5 / PN500) TaxID=670386 RepID=D3BSX8_HETP5|nr:hypothetical protein PPL_11098 [Heterostelium album PN500]EFA75593.1 hypothetical protein PPL_11098 [Heterostelium album PN500]|eukprot:XP_020427727.1 hypothetical protein PPL_11098 [Heterostelium album PN500]
MFLNVLNKYTLNRSRVVSSYFQCNTSFIKNHYCNTNININLNISKNDSIDINNNILPNLNIQHHLKQQQTPQTQITTPLTTTTTTNNEFLNFYANKNLLNFLSRVQQQQQQQQSLTTAESAKNESTVDPNLDGYIQLEKIMALAKGDNRKLLDISVPAQPGDIIVTYNDKFNSIELVVVVGLTGNGYTVINQKNKFNLSKNVHIMTIPTSNDQLIKSLHQYIDLIDQQLQLQPYDPIAQQSNKRLKQQDRQQQQQQQEEVVDKQQEIIPPNEIVCISQHPICHTFEKVNFFMFQMSNFTKREKIIPIDDLYDQYKKPRGGNGYFEMKPWSASQSHYDVVPMIEVAKSIYEPMSQSQPRREKQHAIWHEIFCLLNSYNFIAYKSTLFSLIDPAHFTCLTEPRSQKMIGLMNLLKRDSLELKIVMKYIFQTLSSNGVQIPRSALFLINDQQIPTMSDHVNFNISSSSPSNLTTQTIRTDKLKSTFNDIITILKDSQHYTFTQEFGVIVKKYLLTPFGLKVSHQKDIINRFVGKNHIPIESKLFTHTNFGIEHSSLLKYQQQQQQQPAKSGTVQTKIGSAKRIVEESFTIDSKKTKDVDDAVGILREGDDIYCVIDDNGDIVGSEIFTSVVVNIRKTNYQEVDSYLNNRDSNGGVNNNNSHSFTESQQKMLDILYERAILRQKKRSANAITVDLPRPELIVENGIIRLTHPDFNSKSNVIVSELMVSANFVAAQFAAQNALPIPFRSQKKSDFSRFRSEYLDKYHPLALAFESTTLMSSAVISTSESAHYGLGIDYYTWATSPIRRYSDILVHRQIKHMLTNKSPFYQQHYLDQIVDPLNRNIKTIKKIQKDSLIGWIYKYLNQEGPKYYNAVLLPNSTAILGKKFMLLDLGLNVVSFDESFNDCPTNEVVQVFVNFTHDGRIEFLKENPNNNTTISLPPRDSFYWLLFPIIFLIILAGAALGYYALLKKNQAVREVVIVKEYSDESSKFEYKTEEECKPHNAKEEFQQNLKNCSSIVDLIESIPISLDSTPLPSPQPVEPIRVSDVSTKTDFEAIKPPINNINHLVHTIEIDIASSSSLIPNPESNNNNNNNNSSTFIQEINNTLIGNENRNTLIPDPTEITINNEKEEIEENTINNDGAEQNTNQPKKSFVNATTNVFKNIVCELESILKPSQPVVEVKQEQQIDIIEDNNTNPIQLENEKIDNNTQINNEKSRFDTIDKSIDEALAIIMGE